MTSGGALESTHVITADHSHAGKSECAAGTFALTTAGKFDGFVGFDRTPDESTTNTNTKPTYPTNGSPAPRAYEPPLVRAHEHEHPVSHVSSRTQVDLEHEVHPAFRLRSALRELSPVFVKICVGVQTRHHHERSAP